MLTMSKPKDPKLNPFGLSLLYPCATKRLELHTLMGEKWLEKQKL